MAARRIGTAVGKQINRLNDIEIPINQAPNNLFSIESETQNGELFWKIKQSKLDSGKKIRQAAFSTAEWNTVKDKLDKQKTLFPSGPYTNNPEGLKILSEDKSLDDMDIRTYKFQVYDELPPADGIFESLVERFTDTKTPQDLVKINFENKYTEFILQILQDYTDDQALENNVAGYFSNVFKLDFTRSIYGMVAVDKELVRRVSFFNLLADRSQSIDVDKGEALSEEDIKKLEAEAAKAFVTSDVERGEDILTEEQIEDRQRFYKQCALMLNIKRLDEKFEDVIIDRQTVYKKFDGPIKEKPFGGRFWRAESKNTEQLITNLVSSKDAGYMFEIPSHIMTQLTPKFRLYKVFNDQKGKLKNVEFIFPMYADINRDKNFKRQQGTKQEGTLPTFLSSQFDKGDGVGLKSFSLDFNGTNPAEARNDVKGQMSLFFQSFADFTRKRVDPKDNEYRFVDLIIQPKPDSSNRTQGVKITSLRQYEPSFYRIRVDMGYNIPKEGDIQGIDETKNKKGESELTRLQNSL